MDRSQIGRCRQLDKQTEFAIITRITRRITIITSWQGTGCVSMGGKVKVTEWVSI